MWGFIPALPCAAPSRCNLLTAIRQGRDHNLILAIALSLVGRIIGRIQQGTRAAGAVQRVQRHS